MLKYTVQKIIDQLLNSSQIKLKSTGVSMEPLFKENDVLYFKKTSFKRIRINDLVSIKKTKKLISHRVIYKTSKYLVTKGDNNTESDGKIYPRQLVGKVCQVKRNGQVFNPESLYLLQSTLYFQEIVKIKEAFEKENINFVFLKGLPLHLYFEKTQPRRIYADCDVLVDKMDFFKAERILAKFGYKKAKTELSKTHKQLKEKDIENTYIKIVNKLPVVFDLHLEAAFMMTQLGSLNALYPQKLIDQFTEELLKTKKKVKINNEFFWILDTEYLILYLALHIFHHNFRGAFRYEFLDKVIKNEIRRSLLEDRKWLRNKKLEVSPFSNFHLHNKLQSSNNQHLFSDLAQTTHKYRLQNFVYPVFVLLKKYYQTPIPKSFLKTIQPSNSYAQNLASKINHLGSIFNDELRIRAGINRFKNLFFLSPSPFWKKLLVFSNPQVVYSIFWVLWRRLFSFFRTFFKPNNDSFK